MPPPRRPRPLYLKNDVNVEKGSSKAGVDSTNRITVDTPLGCALGTLGVAVTADVGLALATPISGRVGSALALEPKLGATLGCALGDAAGTQDSP